MIVAALKVKKTISVIKSGLRPIERPVVSLNDVYEVYEVNENYISVPETQKENHTM